MRLTVQEYKRLRLYEGMSDKDIMKLDHAPKYKSMLTQWKRLNGLPLAGSGSRIHLLEKEEVLELLQHHSVTNTAKLLHVDHGNFVKWLKEKDISR